MSQLTDRPTDASVAAKTVKLEAEIELNLWEIEPVKSLPSVEQVCTVSIAGDCGVINSTAGRPECRTEAHAIN